MFAAMGAYAFFVFAVFNVFAVAIVFCFYPEVSCRTLEEIDFLFASKTPFVWETEKRFRELKAEHPELAGGAHREGRGVSSRIEVDEKGMATVERLEGT